MKRRRTLPGRGLKDSCSHFFCRCCSGVSHSVISDMHIIQQENPYKSTKGRVFADDDEDNGITSRSVRLGLRCWEGIVGHSERLLWCLLRSSCRFEDQTPGRFSSRWEDESEEKGWKKESVKPEPDFFLTSTITSVHDKYASVVFNYC